MINVKACSSRIIILKTLEKLKGIRAKVSLSYVTLRERFMRPKSLFPDVDEIIRVKNTLTPSRYPSGE